MSTIATPAPDQTTDPTDLWSRFFGRLVPILAVVGPALALAAALFVTLQVQMLPDDLDWISEPESLLFYLGAIAFPVTWIVIGRAIARQAPRTGIVVTIAGVLGSFTGVSAAAWRHMSIDLVDHGVDPNLVNEVWENPTLYSALAILVTFPAFFITPIIAGIAVVRTKVAPAWTGVALLCFGPTLMAAQGFYAAIEITYPLAWIFMLSAVVGVLRADSAGTSTWRSPDSKTS